MGKKIDKLELLTTNLVKQQQKANIYFSLTKLGVQELALIAEEYEYPLYHSYTHIFLMLHNNVECTTLLDQLRKLRKLIDESPKGSSITDERFQLLRGSNWKNEIDAIRKTTVPPTLEKLVGKYGEEEGTKRYTEFRHNISFAHTLEGKIAKHGEEEGTKRYTDWTNAIGFGNTLEGMIQNYGEIDGRTRYEKYTAACSKGHTLEGRIELHGEERGTEIHKKAIYDSTISLERFIEKYGEEEGTSRFEGFVEERIFARSLEGLIAKHGEEEGAKIYEERKLAQKRSRSLEGLIEKHGKEEGTKRFENNRVSFTFAKASKESLKFFEALAKECNLEMDEIHIGKDKREYFIYDKHTKSVRFYDFKYKNKIIEYNGCRWHPHVENMTEEELETWKTPFGTTGKEALENDDFKTALARSHGFDILHIWNDDTFESNIEKAKDFLLEE